MSDDVRTGKLTVVSEERGKYTFSLAGDLDALEWVWILEHAKRKVLTEKPSGLDMRPIVREDLRARKVG